MGWSGSRKGEQRREIPSVRRLQRRHIVGPCVSDIDKVESAPGEGRSAKPLGQQIRRQARVSAIAVREDVDGDQLVMEIDGDLVRILRAGVNLGADVSKQLDQMVAQRPPVVAADVAFRTARLARPAPDVRARSRPVTLLASAQATCRCLWCIGLF